MERKRCKKKKMVGFTKKGQRKKETEEGEMVRE